MPTVEYGTKTAADAARDKFSEHLCPDDDRRLKTVRFTSDTPDEVLRQARLEAEDSREVEATGPGQVPLSETEAGHIDFSAGRANVPHAQAVKGIALDEGVDDWVAYYDPTLTVDEHRQVMADAGQEGGGRRMDSEDSDVEQAAQASRTAMSEECDHAAGHCAHGDVEACEYIEEQCDLDPDRVLARAEPERPEEVDPDPPQKPPLGTPDSPDDAGSDLSGEELGALKRSWGGYHGAVEALAEAIEQVRQEWSHAQEAAKAINSIRAENGQPPLHFEALEAAQGDLADLLRTAAEDCEECHAGTTGEKESLAALVGGPTPASPAATRGHRATDD